MIKKFFQSKEGKRASWTVLNSVMALVVSGITFYASENVAWAITILPIAQALSQFITKYINK